jgi:hypothetical protein
MVHLIPYDLATELQATSMDFNTPMPDQKSGQLEIWVTPVQRLSITPEPLPVTLLAVT